MKYSLAVNVFVGMVWLMVAGCGTSESGSPEEYQLAGEEVQSGDKEAVETIQASMEENLNEYVKIVEGKMGQLLDKHAKLVDQAQQTGSGTEAQVALDANLEDLTKKGKEVQRQINKLKAAKGKDWLALQSGMNQALEELAQSYDKALAQFPG